MCGIIAYKGNRNAVEIVLEGLQNLEYRGYDSWGIASKSAGKLFITKKVGKIGKVKLADLGLKNSKMAFGHTRWATHGGVTEINAHPHFSCDNKIVVVHNGIIENYQELKKRLSNHKFVSDTDTEVIPHLIEEYISSGFVNAVRKALGELEGRFAIIAKCKDSDEIVAARRGSPLIIGVGKNETFIASDIPAFIKHTREVIFLKDNDMVVLNKQMTLSDISTGKHVHRKIEHVGWAAEDALKGSYPHFMIKEIIEQRQSIAKAIAQPHGKITKIANMINSSYGTFFVSCGTAGKVGLAGTYLFSKIAGKHVNFSFGSEFPSYHDFLTDRTLLVAISQSGETADTLEAIEVAKKKGAKIVSIVNAIGSTMSRISDDTIYVNAGPEKSVCSTKATTGQLAIVTLLAYACAGKTAEGKKLLAKASKLAGSILTKEYLEKVEGLAKKLAKQQNIYIIGRGINYPMALEASIKLQEVPYVNAQGFAGGELKHGSIALIEKGTPCIVLFSNDETKKEIISNAMEVKSRGGYIIGVGPENNEVFDYYLAVPDAGIATAILNIIPIQALSYYLAIERGCDPDKPRNLAKSVTVK